MDQEAKKKTWITPVVERINLEFDKDMTSPCVASNVEPSPATSCGAGTGCFAPIVEG